MEKGGVVAAEVVAMEPVTDFLDGGCLTHSLVFEHSMILEVWFLVPELKLFFFSC